MEASRSRTGSNGCCLEASQSECKKTRKKLMLKMLDQKDISRNE
tara:strand:+ start:978 stop:1109 length:132 start_codon:yes stop_codon:yes gene_type:complete